MKKTRKKRKAKPNRKYLWVVLALLLVLSSITGYLFSTVTTPKIVYIPKGSLFKSIAHLQEEGVNVHKVDALILKVIGQPQQGWIDIRDEKMSRLEFLYRLTTAKAATNQATLIPGETTTIFIKQLATNLHMDEAKLKSAYSKHATFKEGNFVPDTYSIPKGSDEEGVIVYLLDKSNKTMKQWAKELKTSDKSDNLLRIVTKASVLQKEAASIADMPMVSSVIDNRMKIGMKLQMDGTLNYGEYSHQKVTAKRIRTDLSPYNTYKHDGLPKNPVCNVSKEAFTAALHPKKTNYLYFVRGKNGEHVYSSYFSTHKKNIANATK